MRLRATTALLDAVRHPRAFVTGDQANIRRLAEKLQCSTADAEAVYRLARRTGYASAHRAVFESPRLPRGVRRVRPLASPAPYPIGARPPIRTVSGRSS